MPRRLASPLPPASLLSDYNTRILLALAAVLSTAVMIAHIPGSETIEYTPWGHGEWSTNQGGGTVTAHDILELYPDTRLIPDAQPAVDEPIQASIGMTSTQETGDASDAVDADPTPDPTPRVFRSVATLGPESSTPRIIGGMQQLYLNVKYPKEAQRQRIQGRVILNFVVHETGHVSDITILRSLHPLCDSAVVRAVRKTTFVPAEENGEAVAVRMALPVRFQLLEVPGLQDFETAPGEGAAATRKATARATPEETKNLDIPR